MEYCKNIYGFYYDFVLFLGVLVSPCQQLQIVGNCVFPQAQLLLQLLQKDDVLW